MAEQTVVALYDDARDADRAMEALRALGVRDEHVSIIAHEGLTYHIGNRADAATKADEPAAPDAAAGGPAGGGLGGALAASGVPERDAHIYAEGVRRGGTLVLVRTSDEMAGRVIAILDHHGATDLDHRLAEYHAAGWTRFDEVAGPYGVVQITDDLLGTEPVEPGGRAPGENLRAPALAPDPGSAAGGVQAQIVRARSYVTGTPGPAHSEPLKPASNTPAARRDEPR